MIVKLRVYSLIGCPHSSNTERILKRLCGNSEKININKISYDDKDKIKKQNKMSTFPQIFLDVISDDNSETIKVGGNSDLETIISAINNAKKKKLKVSDIIDKLGGKLNGSKRAKLELFSILMNC